MKNLLRRRVSKVVSGFAALATAMVLAYSLTASATGTFGPDRPTKVWSPTVSGFNYVTFNSFTNVGNGIGDERDFYNAVEVGRDSVWSNPLQSVDHGSEIEAKIYIHNNADASLNESGVGVAHNVTVRVTLPSGLASSQDTTAYISASNANPTTIFDTMQITGANNGMFGLQYENGTAQLHEQNGTVTNLTSAQEAAMLSGTGVNLGDQNGCFQYVQEITFKMKVQMPNYTLLKQVGEAGQSTSTLTKSINANAGDTLGWLLTFNNAGETPLNHVKIVDNVPAGLTVVPGSVKLINGNYPNGYVYPDTAVQANGRQINVDIGNYNPGINAFVTYRTTVEPASAMTCGLNSFVNQAFATPEGLGAIEATATANATKTCQPTTPPTTPPTTLVNTGPGEVVGLFGGATAAGAFGYRKFLSRRLGR